MKNSHIWPLDDAATKCALAAVLRLELQLWGTSLVLWKAATRDICQFAVKPI